MLGAFWGSIDSLVAPGITTPSGERVTARRECAFRWSRTVQKAAAELLLPHVRKNIVIHPPCGFQRTPPADGQFHVFLFSTPRDTGFREEPSYLWVGGDSFWAKKQVFKPSGLLEPLIGPRELELGEFDSRGLYLFFDPVRDNPCVADRHVLEAAFGDAGDLLAKLSASQVQARNDVRLVRVRRTQKRRFSLKNLELRNDYERVKEDITKAKKAFKSASKLLNDALEYEEAAGYESVVSEKVLASAQTRAGQDWDEISRIPQVETAEVKGEVLAVHTRELYCINPATEQTYLVGPMEILVFMDGSKGVVRWFRKGGAVQCPSGRTFQAPNVGGDGRAVSIAMTEMFSDLVAEEQYAAVVSMAIAMIESPDTAILPLCNFSIWPEC